MTNYTAFLYIDAGTGRTHLCGWDPVAKEWRVPCGLIKQPGTDLVTYTPDKPLCRNCSHFTRGLSPGPSLARRTRHR